MEFLDSSYGEQVGKIRNDDQGNSFLVEYSQAICKTLLTSEDAEKLEVI